MSRLRGDMAPAAKTVTQAMTTKPTPQKISTMLAFLNGRLTSQSANMMPAMRAKIQ